MGNVFSRTCMGNHNGTLCQLCLKLDPEVLRALAGYVLESSVHQQDFDQAARKQVGDIDFNTPSTFPDKDVPSTAVVPKKDAAEVKDWVKQQQGESDEISEADIAVDTEKLPFIPPSAVVKKTPLKVEQGEDAVHLSTTVVMQNEGGKDVEVLNKLLLHPDTYMTKLIGHFVVEPLTDLGFDRTKLQDAIQVRFFKGSLMPSFMLTIPTSEAVERRLEAEATSAAAKRRIHVQKLSQARENAEDIAREIIRSPIADADALIDFVKECGVDPKLIDAAKEESTKKKAEEEARKKAEEEARKKAEEEKVVTITLAGGHKYVGTLKDGVPHGPMGTIYYADTDPNKRKMYVGPFEEGMRHGAEGTLTWADGRKYVGPFKEDKFHGDKGTLYRSDGSIWYVGPFKEDKKHGAEGTMYYADGSKYVGGWKEDKKHGDKGTYTWADGDKYVGPMKEGKFHGDKGTVYRSDGSIEYVGPWKENKRDGDEGTEYYPDGEIHYVGPWKEDKRHPHGNKGTEYRPDGSIAWSMEDGYKTIYEPA